jgi:hypothetical protein
VAAAALADVLARHPDPLVALGVEHHPLDQAAILLLLRGALREIALHPAQAGREVVAHALQLAQGEHARPGHGGHRPVQAGARIGRGEGLGELALEAGDLLAQRPARGPLVDLDDRGARQDGRRRVQGLFEQFHPATSSLGRSLPAAKGDRTWVRPGPGGENQGWQGSRAKSMPEASASPMTPPGAGLQPPGAVVLAGGPP